MNLIKTPISSGMDNDSLEDEKKDLMVSFALTARELAGLTAWAKAHDVSRARALRCFVRHCLHTNVKLDTETDYRMSEPRRQRQAKRREQS